VTRVIKKEEHLEMRARQRRLSWQAARKGAVVCCRLRVVSVNSVRVSNCKRSDYDMRVSTDELQYWSNPGPFVVHARRNESTRMQNDNRDHFNTRLPVTFHDSKQGKKYTRNGNYFTSSSFSFPWIPPHVVCYGTFVSTFVRATRVPWAPRRVKRC
jgi:hypothetical protein